MEQADCLDHAAMILVRPELGGEEQVPTGDTKGRQGCRDIVARWAR